MVMKLFLPTEKLGIILELIYINSVPNHQIDLTKQSSRSPKVNLRSRSSTPRKNMDSSRRSASVPFSIQEII